MDQYDKFLLADLDTVELDAVTQPIPVIKTDFSPPWQTILPRLRLKAKEPERPPDGKFFLVYRW